MSLILLDQLHSRSALARVAFTALLLTVLAACGPLARKGVSESSPGTAAHPEDAAPRDQAYGLLQKAEKAVSPERERLLLQAAAIYREAGDHKRLGRLMGELDPRTLKGDALVSYSRIYGRWALERRQLMIAETVLLNPALVSHWESLDLKTAAELHGLRAELFEAERRPLEAINERLLQSPLSMDTASQQTVSEATWRLLSQLRDDEFQTLEARPQNQLLGGWVALARIQRQGFDDIEKQAAQVQDWQRSWPTHPANRFMPADMRLLRRLLDEQPRHIALLLPFTGKRAQAGRAVRDGFLSGYYRALGRGAPGVQVDMVDSNAWPDIGAAYQAAVAGGAEMVIGPLEREQVQALASMQNLAVPTLALNNPSNDNQANDKPAAANLYQFSLNPEDEARQVAEAAWANRHWRAVVITPDEKRGERLRQGFVGRWQALGAEVMAQVRYEPDSGNYNVPVAEALGLDLRTGQMRAGAGLPDMVFFAGNLEDAGAVMQALASNNAGAVPVYTTSGIQADMAQAALTRRADGIRYCLSPWQLGQGPLRAAGETLPAGAEMLFAMGADAQQLYLRLPLMQANSSLHVSGNTGYLHLDPARRVERKMAWAVLQGGQPQQMPAITGGQ